MNLIEEIVENSPSIRDIRRDIHAHPELAFEENRTSDLVAQLLESWGIPVHRGFGKTGLVGARWACAPTWTRCPCTRSTSSATRASIPA
jgi:metal-dependent amidase/aminoacylase/carboxypeptidase family protein